ncbi:uncharacterized protein [Oscarella lobularis]|uniref:uncharacterized protein n=1 Tax=Oscarella lobularis TaxID=121494 RepID=UPI0033142661
MQFRLFVLTAVLLCFTPEICSAHSPLHTIIKVKYAAEQIIKELSGSPAAAAAAGVEAEAAPAHVPQRSKRAAPYSPVTTPSYDFGPKTACSKPDVSGCSVESSVTIPSYLTRFTTGTLGNAIDELVDVVKETVNNDCGDSVRDMFCELIAQPICTSDNKAMYNFNLQEKCNAVVQTCSTGSAGGAFLQSTLCSEDISDVYKLNGRSYPLTDCRVPQVDFCSNTATSPDWLVASFELNGDSFSDIEELVDIALVTDDDGTCKESYFELACTVATCDGDNIRGYRDANTCQRVVDCFQPMFRETAAKILQCSGQERVKSGLTLLFVVGLGLILAVVEVF